MRQTGHECPPLVRVGGIGIPDWRVRNAVLARVVKKQRREQVEVEAHVGQRGSAIRSRYTRDKLDQPAAATHRVVPFVPRHLVDDLATAEGAMPWNRPAAPAVAAIDDRLLWSDSPYVSFTVFTVSQRGLASGDSCCRRHNG